MGIEHVYVVYDPMRPLNRFDLGFRKVATSIELSHYDIFDGDDLPAPTLLNIDEIEGNMTTIVHNATHESLREKVFYVLSNYGNVHTPIHTQTFTPRHLSALTVTLRRYDAATGTFEPETFEPIDAPRPPLPPKVGLWFKIQTEDC
jgi:hypothetical protein